MSSPSPHSEPAGQGNSGTVTKAPAAGMVKAYRVVTALTWVCLAGGLLGIVLPLIPSIILLPAALVGVVATLLLAKPAGRSLKQGTIMALSAVLILVVAIIAVIVLVLFVIIGAGTSGYV